MTGELIHVVGTNIGDRGRLCSVHTMIPCDDDERRRRRRRRTLGALREIRKTTINNYASIGRDSAEREGERERER